MPIHYDLKRIGFYTVLALGLFGGSLLINTGHIAANVAIKTILFGIYIYMVIKTDFPLDKIPYISKLFKRK